MEATPFPRGSVDLHACRLFKTKKLCTTASIVRVAHPTTTQPSQPRNYPSTQPSQLPNNPIAAAATMLQSAKYINKIEGLNANDVGTYSTTNTAFKDAFTGHYDSGSGRTSIAPKSSDCTQAPHRICTAHAPQMQRTLTRSAPVAPIAHPDPMCPNHPIMFMCAVRDVRKECRRRRERE